MTKERIQSDDPSTDFPKRVAEALEADRDIWAEEVLSRPEGPTYQNVKDYLPPLRYVNASFKHYPIVLGLKEGLEKIRLVGNGSQIGLSINPWRLDGSGWTAWFQPDLKAFIQVGRNETPFGDDISKLNGPKYLEGYLPVVRLAYAEDGVLYGQEVFAASIPGLEPRLFAYVKLTAKASGRSGTRKASVSVRFETPSRFTAEGDLLMDEAQRYCCQFNPGWRFDPEASTLTYDFDLAGRTEASAFLLIPNRPLSFTPLEPLNEAAYEQAKRDLSEYWEAILSRAVQITVPEKIVNDALRALIVQTFILTVRDEVRYSSGNIYDRQYLAECGDAILALAMLGYEEEAIKYLRRLQYYKQAGLEYHNDAFRLQEFAQYYLLFRDIRVIERDLPVLIEACESISASRKESESGLIPRERFAGDIPDLVDNLSSNANAWRGLRDMSLVLAMIGRDRLAERYSKEAEELREAILSAVDKSVVGEFDPPFVPLRLLEEAKPFEKLTASRYGGYYNLVIPYVLGSDIFSPDDKRTGYIMETLEKRGGLLLGLIRFSDGLDDLYTLRYTFALLKRSEVEKFLVGFYAKLAHGLTRETFIGTEASSVKLAEGETFRRLLGLAPNTTSGALFLQSLRYMLLMERDSGNDGLYDTLLLFHATPRDWLRDGEEIVVEDAPTCFGEVSVHVRSEIDTGAISATVKMPRREGLTKTVITLRTPEAKGIRKVTVNGEDHRCFDAGAETVDLSGLHGELRIRVEYGE